MQFGGTSLSAAKGVESTGESATPFAALRDVPPYN